MTQSALVQAFFVSTMTGGINMNKIISIKELTFAYPGQSELFSKASFELSTTWRLGLLGRNGRGKTTLFKLLQNILPFKGQINVPLELAYFPQPLQDKSELALFCLQANNNFEEWELRCEMQLFGLDEDLLWRPFDTLSGGEQTKLMLCALFCQKDAFFLLDEPTNHLDIVGRNELVTYLHQKKQGFIITSHDRVFLDQVIDHTLVIEKNQITLTKGDLTTYQLQKDRRDTFDKRQNEKTRHELARLKKAALTKENCAKQAEQQKQNNSHADKGFIGHRAAKVMKRAEHLNKRLQEQIKTKEQQLKNIETSVPLSINYQKSHKKILITAEDLTLAYPEKKLFSKLNFTVNTGQIVIIKGANGQGKSSIFKALLGQSELIKNGSLTLATERLSLLKQDTSENTGTLADFTEKHGLDYTLFLTLLKKLGVSRQTFATKIEHMSQGQQKKVALACMLATPAELYLLDEPLNYLDTFNQDQLLELFSTVHPTMLVIEHDQNFITKLADKIIEL